MPSFDEIAAFVSQYTGIERSLLTETTTLHDDLGLYGSDMDLLIFEYAERFGVDLSGSLWYFHNCEDGYNIGALFVRPPNKRVKHIPITIGMLHEFAEAGRWNIPYPDHTLPRLRLDTLINRIIAIFLLLFIIYKVVKVTFGE